MNFNLEEKDPEIFSFIKEEEDRQKKSLELIASENYVNSSIFECLGSVLTNKYSEGLPNKRYYGGCQIIDKIETTCIQRALKAFHLNEDEWGVNVQPYSGSIANICAYNSILNPHDRIMGLDLPSGGHLSHGYYTSNNKVSATSVFYESMPYTINKKGYIDYDNMKELARVFKPKLIICGASAYPRDIDYKKIKEIASLNNSFMLCDMSHISGFIATGQMNNPFDYCDLVTTTTHKTMRGPRASLIFFRKTLEKQVNMSVFPSIQGGPHQNNICGVAVQLKEVMSDEFKKYIIEVKNNAQILAKTLMNKGYNISTNGTDNHIVLVDLHNIGISGSKIENLCNDVDISLNKNYVYGDDKTPNGIRLGTGAFTTRGGTEKDFIYIGNLLDKVINLAINIQIKSKSKLLKDFILKKEDFNLEIKNIKDEVNQFTTKFDYYIKRR